MSKPQITKSNTELRQFMDQFTAALDSLAEGVSLSARDEVTECLSQYNEFVPAYDERLQQLKALLERGLRDEALGYEAEEPPLLDAVTLLDLSSRPAFSLWMDTLADNGIPEPAMPKLEHAAELRAAQDKVAVLRPLLDQWRRENIAGFSLPERMKTLRKLRKNDPENEAWYSLLMSFERQRLIDIESDLRGAIASNDESRLAAIVEELGAAWLEKPPAKLEQQAKQALGGLRGSRIDREIAEVAAGLAAAAEHRDLDTCKTLRDRWNRLIAKKGTFAVDDPHVARAEPAVEWVDRHERMTSLLTEVWHGLDARPAAYKSRSEWVRSLTRMRDEVEDLVEHLPEEVDHDTVERLRDRVARVEDDHRREMKHRRGIVVAAVVGVAVLVAGTLTAVVSHLRRGDQMQKVLAELAALEERAGAGEGVAEALDATEKAWPEWLAADPVVRSRASQARATLAAEDQRRQQVATFEQEIGPHLDALTALALPETITDWPAPFKEASRILASATKGNIAKSQPEKAVVTRAEGRLDAATKRWHRTADDVFIAQANALTSRLAQAAGAASSDPAEAVEELADIEKEIKVLRSLAAEPAIAGAAPPLDSLRKVTRNASRLVDENESLSRGIADLRERLASFGRFIAQEQRLNETLGDWPAYAAKLSALAKDFPNLAEARDYSEAALQEPTWRGLADWNRFVATTTLGPKMTAADARKAKTEITSLTADAKKLLFVAQFEERYSSLLDSFKERDLNAARLDLLDWTQREWLEELDQQIIHTQGEAKTIYYARSLEQFKNSRRFRYQREMKNAEGWPEPENSAGTTGEAEKLVSPQKKLGEALAIGSFERLTDTSRGLEPDLILVDALEKIVSADDVEPCVRMVNLRKLLLVGKKVSRFFKEPEALAFFSRLDDGNTGIPGITIEDIGEFLDPNRQNNPKYVRVRRFSEKILADAADLITTLRQSIAETAAAIAAPKLDSYECVGRVGRNHDGSLRLIAGKGPQPTRIVEAIVINPDGSPTVAGKTDGKGALEIAKEAKLIAGLPCFVRRPRPLSGDRSKP